MAENQRKREEAENRVRKLIQNIPFEHIQDFYVELDKNLRNSGSNKTVADMLQEIEQHPIDF